MTKAKGKRRLESVCYTNTTTSWYDGAASDNHNASLCPIIQLSLTTSEHNEATIGSAYLFLSCIPLFLLRGELDGVDSYIPELFAKSIEKLFQ